MKKTTNSANAINNTFVAGTAKSKMVKAAKSFILFFFAGMTLVLSSCSRNTGIGCNSFACKSNLKYSNERKYTKYSVNMYKCPTNQRISR
ncbi:MAG TPA: hypothetical protein PLX60_09420 [Chitinophagales bacterium]|jgi:hypothetical protein|nr:hypothetical protein [Chitinophagales bacterium]